MAYTHKQLPDLPILIFTCDQGASLMSALLPMIGDLTRRLDRQPEPVFVIFDTRGMTLDMEDMLIGARISARGRDAVLHHPNIRENIFVIVDPMMKMGLRALNSATFGFVHLSSFETLDEALAYCHEKLGIADWI